MPVFLCRWPNGDFSIVAARNREDAIFELDEWDNAELAQIWKMEKCMVDFTLNDLGRIELSQLGQQTRDEIMEKCYPDLEKTLTSDPRLPDDGREAEAYPESAKQVIKDAVDHERQRMTKKKRRGKNADTELGRDIQRQMGAASVVVNRLSREHARRVLASRAGERGKPN